MGLNTARYAIAAIRAANALLQGFLGMLPRFPGIARTLYLKAINRSDYERWRHPDSLETWWEPRTRKIATLIPKGIRVIEFGAGQRWLESYLDPSCSYIPSDLIDRGQGTVICDLNHRPLPDLRPMRPDVAVFVGVLEYVKDLASVVFWLSRQFNSCVASYDCANTKPGTIRRILENLRRVKFGYMSTYTEPDLIELFARSGFTCVRIETWNEQRLFLFKLITNLPL